VAGIAAQFGELRPGASPGAPRQLFQVAAQTFHLSEGPTAGTAIGQHLSPPVRVGPIAGGGPMGGQSSGVIVELEDQHRVAGGDQVMVHGAPGGPQMTAEAKLASGLDAP